MSNALMNPLAGLVIVAALVLCAAAVGKAAHPENAAAAVRLLGLPAGTALIRIIAGLELAVSLWALLAPSRAAAAALALAYTCFAAIVITLLAGGHHTVSCGCFGVNAAHLSALHAALNVFIAASAGAAALIGHTSVPAPQTALVATTMLVGALAGAYATVLVLTRLPLSATDSG